MTGFCIGFFGMLAWTLLALCLGLLLGRVCTRTRELRNNPADQRGEGGKVRGGVQSHGSASK